MTLKQFRSLSVRMLLFATAILLPMLMLMAYIAWQDTEAKINEERTRAAHLADILGREQALPFALGRQKLHDLLIVRAIAEPLDAAACHDALKQAAAESAYMTIINLYSTEGTILCSSGDAPSPPVADREWFRQTIAQQRIVVSDYLVGKTTGKSAVAMARPLFDGRGGLRAVLMLGIDLSWMGRALANVPVAEGTNIVVVDSAGTVLAPEHWIGRSVGGHPVFKRIAGITEATSFEATGIDGVERIFVARPLNSDLGGRSYLWVAAPKSSVSVAALRDFLSRTLLVLATALALFTTIWWEGSRLVLRPVRFLRDAAQRLGHAQLSARTNLPHSDDEIGQLALSFDEMAEQIETRERELEHSRESLLRANRTLRVLDSVKDVIAGTRDKQMFLDELCRTVASIGGYPIVYVGRAENDPGKTVTVLAAEGLSREFREQLQITWEDVERGRGAAGTAIRENRTVVIHDVRNDPRYAPWHDLVIDRDIDTVTALPIRFGERVWGVLVLSSTDTQANVFDAEEVRLLEDLAGDVGHGIETLRLRAEKQVAEDALLSMMDDLERRVDERTRDLEAANRDLQSFSYSVSHDLRAPLRSIEGFAQALDDECGSILNEDCRGHLERIRGAAQRMGGLIEDMIRLAQISNLEMRTTTVDLTALAAGIGADLAAAEPQRQIRLTVAPGLVTRGDPGLMRVLVQNLLANAWKYSSRTPRAEIEFGVMQLPSNEMAYFVRDNGAGFDMAFADRLFRPFSRLHHADAFPGTGIGLATVARIVARHGGRVWAEAERGKGATFYFALDQGSGGGNSPHGKFPA